MRLDWIVVGAGFTGATFAERMATAGKHVLLVDRRAHVAGNAYDENNDHAILVHRYGPHLFHTNSLIVWKYLSSFTKWRPYEHRVLGLLEEKLVPIPFNLNSLAALFPSDLATSIKDALTAEHGFGSKVPILKLKNSTKPVIREFADYVYRNVFERYTFKQWQLRPEQLSPSVTARVPVNISYDDRYFQDTYQAIPLDGYTAMFGKILAHPNIKVILNADWKEIASEFQAERIMYTGALDELLNYRFGPLPYRSLRFEESTLNEVQHQPAGTINYPNNHAYTRITEQKIITGQRAPNTSLITEYPMAHEPGRNIAYYPVPRDENQLLYVRYLEAARAEFPNILFAGRLADYQYYNMDQACARALMLASENGGPPWSQT